MSDDPSRPAPISARPPRYVDHRRVSFRADYLHALAPIIRAGEEPELHRTAGLMVEPIQGDGALLIATDGRRLAVLHDRTARVTERMRMTIPENILGAVKPPKGCAMWSEGESFYAPAPEWMEPGRVWAFGLAMYVLPKMHIPGDDPRNGPVLAHADAEEGSVYAGGFRFHPKSAPFSWRDLFSRDRGQPQGRVVLHPSLVAGFRRIDRLLGTNGVAMSFGAPDQPVVLTVPGRPEFLGAVMPCSTRCDHLALPAWALPDTSAVHA